MKKLLYLSVLSTLFFSCSSTKSSIDNHFTFVKVDTLLIDKISIRSLVVSKDKVWYAGDKNRVGYLSLNNANKMQREISANGIAMEFRSSAQTTDAFFALTVANPAFLYKFSKDLNSKRLVYEERNEKVFYDSMNFWNDKEGIAIGDPINDCFCVIITRDGGETWQKVPCEKLPKVVVGEAAFAASNTNIIIKGENTWIVSGGKKARVFFSSDKGKSWKVYTTPIVQGEVMTGIFTADFYDSQTGIVAGGNYEKPNQNFQNKAITHNGGKSWKLIGENQGFGYASCIQFVPNSNAKQLVCIGTSGLYYSKDSGATWQQFLKDSTLFTIRFIDENTAIAAGKDKIVRLEFK